MNRYVELAMRTNDRKQKNRLIGCIGKDYAKGEDNKHSQIINACMGLCGEVGELTDIVKKHIFHEKELDEEHLKKELGDVMWYVALLCDAMDWELDDVLTLNIAKLKARYPEGFDIEMANNRKEGDI